MLAREGNNEILNDPFFYLDIYFSPSCVLAIDREESMYRSKYLRKNQNLQKTVSLDEGMDCLSKAQQTKRSHQSQKKKESVENSTLGSRPPCQCGKIQPDFLCFWHDSEQLWQKMYLPLNKV